jgi:hypothetical protein
MHRSNSLRNIAVSFFLIPIHISCNRHEQLTHVETSAFSMGLMQNNSASIDPRVKILSPNKNDHATPLQTVFCQIEIDSDGTEKLPSTISLGLVDSRGREHGYGGVALPKARIENRFTFQGSIKAPNYPGDFFLSFTLRYKIGHVDPETGKLVKDRDKNIIFKSEVMRIRTPNR